jgi:serine/threonine protein kinase/tetratricopeptide (TPR) repeat protein
MAGEFVCSLGHRWRIDAQVGAIDRKAARCPHCGNAGHSTDDQSPLETSLAPMETLAPGEVPSLVSPLDTVILRPDDKHRLEATRPLPRIPGYDIVEELGRGGMGVVYKARHKELGRYVAVKTVLAGPWASDEVIHRFRAEAEAVARLQHPNIVQIYDIGEYDCLQYLVLEYVSGGTLSAKLDGRPQPVAVAAQIVEALSRAVAYAHREGVVHRDLTPANVLLCAAPGAQAAKSDTADEHVFDPRQFTAKITDFGLAKRLDMDAGTTRTGAVMGTPSYMSPEQASGQAQSVGPAADIYALGALLYQLLTGRPPFVGETAVATIEQVQHQDPVPPIRLQPRTPRDLDTICLKCLEKDPRKRYASANDLADDLQRFLTGVPIRARRTSAISRGIRWSKRKPATAALLAVSGLMIVVFLVGSQAYNRVIRSERDRAEHNFRLALRAVDDMLTEVGETSLAFEPGMDEKRRVLLKKALALYQEFLTQKVDDARLRLETAHAHRRVGDIERWLGDYSAAPGAYASAIAILNRLRALEPSNAEYRRWLAYCHNFLGEAQRQAGQTAEAERSYISAIGVARLLRDDVPDLLDAQQELARASYNLGILYRETSRPGRAERTLNEAIGLLTRLVSEDPENVSYRQDLARAHINLGPVLRASMRFADAQKNYDSAIELLGALVDQLPARADYGFELAVVHSNRGNLHHDRKASEEALADYDRASNLLRALIADHPRVPTFRQELANVQNSLAAMQAAGDDLPGAEKTWTEAVGLLRQLVKQNANLPSYRADLGMALGNLGWVRAQQRRFSEAGDTLRDGIDQLDSSLQANPRHPDYTASLRSQLHQLAEVSLELADYGTVKDVAGQLATLEGPSGQDDLAAALFLVRAAGLISENSQRTPQHVAAAKEFCEEAARLIRGAAAKSVDEDWIERNKAFFAARFDDYPDLKDALAQYKAAGR